MPFLRSVFLKITYRTNRNIVCLAVGLVYKWDLVGFETEYLYKDVALQLGHPDEMEACQPCVNLNVVESCSTSLRKVLSQTDYSVETHSAVQHRVDIEHYNL